MTEEEERLARIEGAIQALADRLGELERDFYVNDDFEDPFIDPLEAAHQRFAEGIRSRREGNA
jgi:hypothetical protein